MQFAFLAGCLTLQANKFILDIIEHGYNIPFISDPPSAQAVNNKSALDHPVFGCEAIHQLLMANVVREVVAPYCCNPLTVATGKK